MKPECSIVILCHNDAHYLENCAKSVFRNTRGVRYELILVDNDSKDNAAEVMRKVKKRAPCPVKIIRTGQNLFFAGGNLRGLQAACGDYVMFLNADTLVPPGWLKTLLGHMRANPNLGMIGPLTNSAVGPQFIKDGCPDFKKLDSWHKAWAAKRAGRPECVPWIIGFCVLMPRALALRTEGFSAAYGPGGYEDYDLCLQLRLLGLEIAVSPDCYVHHFGGKGYAGMDYHALRATNQTFYWNAWTAKILERLP
ncbi:MAG: glycosyltransferase [Elusimicrobia bacterium]|nr:glycosyltransferase [Elusimicrobiota bacterium]